MTSNLFRLESDRIYRCEAFQQFVWLKHGFGTRIANPEVDVTLRQIHSDRVVNAAGLKNRECEGDALVTDEIAKCIGVRTADCVPILLVDSHNHVVAAVHAGWRGTAAGIVKHAIDKMNAEFGTSAADLYAAMGPCIRVCCYEVGPEVAVHFNLTGRCNLDLPHANRRQMQELVQDLRSDRVDRLALGVGQVSLRELRSADCLGPSAQRRDRRDDVERRLPGAELLCFLRNDGFRTLGLAPPAVQ